MRTASGFIAANSGTPIRPRVSGVPGSARTIQSNSPRRGCHSPGRSAPLPAAPAHYDRLDAEALQHPADRPPDRALPEDQRLAAGQFASARCVVEELVRILRPDDRAVALRHRQHRHHREFGDGGGSQAFAAGQHHAAPLQLRQRHPVDAGVGGVEPAQARRRGNRRERRDFLVQVEPADLRHGRERDQLLRRTPPVRFDPRR
jgi:hypothetical protein